MGNRHAVKTELKQATEETLSYPQPSNPLALVRLGHGLKPKTLKPLNPKPETEKGPKKKKTNPKPLTVGYLKTRAEGRLPQGSVGSASTARVEVQGLVLRVTFRLKHEGHCLEPTLDANPKP